MNSLLSFLPPSTPTDQVFSSSYSNLIWSMAQPLLMHIFFTLYLAAVSVSRSVSCSIIEALFEGSSVRVQTEFVFPSNNID